MSRRTTASPGRLGAVWWLLRGPASRAVYLRSTAAAVPGRRPAECCRRPGHRGAGHGHTCRGTPVHRPRGGSQPSRHQPTPGKTRPAPGRDRAKPGWDWPALRALCAGSSPRSRVTRPQRAPTACTEDRQPEESEHPSVPDHSKTDSPENPEPSPATGRPVEAEPDNGSRQRKPTYRSPLPRSSTTAGPEARSTSPSPAGRRPPAKLSPTTESIHRSARVAADHPAPADPATRHETRARPTAGRQQAARPQHVSGEPGAPAEGPSAPHRMTRRS